METETMEEAKIDMVIPLEVAVAGDAHVKLDVKIQVMTCPSVKELVVKIALFVPAFTPSTFH